MIRLGTRGSLLARTQSGLVADALARLADEPVELVVIATEGDDTSVPLDSPSRPGAFVSALRDALLAGSVDVVVHSFKDLPSAPAPGLVVAAIPLRAPHADVLVSRAGALADLPAGARVGTSSPRRAAALARFRPDLAVVPIRGNVDTRIGKVRTGEVDAAVLAAAGLHRVGRQDEIAEVIGADVLVPAPAQGALAVECRADSPLRATLAALDDLPTRLAVTAERAVLAGVQAACTTAIGALATWTDGRLELTADLSDHAGVGYARVNRGAHVTGLADADALGAEVARALLSQGTPTLRQAQGSSDGSSLPTGHPLLGPTADSPLIRSYRGVRTRHRAIWMMRQAGRSLPEYRAVRAGTGMLQACLTPELAAEITCQPVRRHGVDAGIFFSDIMVPLKLAGVGVDIVAGVGPVLDHPVRTAADVDALPELHPDALAPIAEGVRLAVAELGATPLIGFCGAPFTVASYLVEGRPSRDYAHTLGLLRDDPGLWRALAGWVARTTGAFLRAQVLAGASAVQLFDSWIGALSPVQYREHVQAHSAAVLASVADLGVPRVHFGTRSRPHLVAMLQAGADVMGVDAATGLDEAAALLGPVPLQGNIDPTLLGADWDTLSAHVLDVLARGAAAPAHVVNLGHGVPPETDPEVLTRLVALVHDTPDEAGVS